VIPVEQASLESLEWWVHAWRCGWGWGIT
jgi:hypothetical protein